ncbi:MAG: hypothetical protein WCI43_03385 [Candidatus Firestonebacteria bacterium]
MGSLEKFLDSTEKGRSLFEAEIRKIKTPVCRQFLKAGRIAPVSFKPSADTVSTKDSAKVFQSFPNLKGNATKIMVGVKGKNTPKLKGLKVAVMFSGGPAAGGHKVVAGRFDMLVASKCKLLGVKSVPKGLI